MSSWKNARISDFCTIGTGGTPSRDRIDRYYRAGTIPWGQIRRASETVIQRTEEKVTEAALQETNLKLVPAGALLLAMYGATVGRLGILGVAATTNQAVCHIIPDHTVAEVGYVFHALRNQMAQLVARGVGGAQPNISQGIVRDFVLPLPSLAEQRRIADVLDRAEALRAKRRAALTQLNTLAKSIFLDLFGDLRHERDRWPIVPLEQIVRETKLGLVRGSQEFGSDYPLPYIRMNSILRNGELDLEAVQRTTATESEIAAYRLEPGDFLFNTRNSEELVGKSALFQGAGVNLFRLFAYSSG